MTMSEHGPKGGGGKDDEDDTRKSRPKTFEDLYPGRFLHAAQLNERQQTIKIVDVYRQKVRGEKGLEPKTIITFERQSDGPCEIVLAKINGTCLRAMFGDPPNWLGKRVTIFPTNKIMPMPMGPEKNKPCIRIYGSPDIDRDIPVTFVVPRRKPLELVMKPTGQTAKQQAPEAAAKPSPGSDADRDAYDNRDPEADR
jgi:hypothetical protein